MCSDLRSKVISGVLLMKKKLPLVTCVLVLLNIVGLLYELAEGETVATLKYGMYEGALRNGEYMRAIVSAFLHFGFYHFACNMLCLVSYGFFLEKLIGPGKYAMIYAAAIAGSALLINYAGGNGIHAGASGAIWGLMTATLIYNLRHQLNPVYALRGILINLIYSFSAGVSWQGHIGGGIAGLAAAAILCKDNGQSEWR